MEKICVAVRVRPPVSGESVENASHWKVEDNRISLHRPLGTPIPGLSYAFDHVFDQECTNAWIYELLTKDIIRAAVDGFNGTAFAYGQTSSGKTYTMNGSDTDPGIIHLAVKDIFQNIKMIADREFLIRVSYMEIYNEEINDLFAPENHKLQIHESLERGIFVAGLREEIVNNAEQVIKLIELGEVNRHFGQTNMNIRSSRSHTIFRMVIESKGKNATSGDGFSADAVRVSVLNLVDLAGSERIAKTGAGGVRLKEGKYINKSLMILGNVINKLSEGNKQRAHIPYRDSKLTRILQPALGGNAKTSIICTISPEEVHIEETRGTLHFASRAKRITNCVQVNEVLTDATLLKRQKLEIEELRRKLQGSHSEVLEQEILKIRNEMLKYELERERLAMELEEERKSHKEREEHIREQQMKIDNLSSLVTFSESDRSSTQGKVSLRQSCVEDSSGESGTLEEDDFGTPNFRAIPNAFVMKRSNYTKMVESSPISDSIVDVADEDMWLRLNNGHNTDLDSVLFTPAKKSCSLPPINTCPVECDKDEVETLRRQLLEAIQEKDELEKSRATQLLINNQLMDEISELQEELLLVRQIPQKMCEAVATCKETYKDLCKIMQSFGPAEAVEASLLSGTYDIGCHLFSTLETHFSEPVDGSKINLEDSLVIQEECKVLSAKVNSAISNMIYSHAPVLGDKHMRQPQEGLASEAMNDSAKCISNFQLLEAIKERCQSLQRECSSSNQLLEASRERCHILEEECHLLREEKTSLIQNLSTSADNVALLAAQKEELLKDLNKALQKRKDMGAETRRLSQAFAHRQGCLATFHNEFKDKFEKLRMINSIMIPKESGV
ncbi:kinesin-like protein KIN-7N [Aristolochia californica]|uniref:kinesin-like protein KIN-7N n=1 Tax=Aristolochia californica TaxID=171875 RepID=UPI0035DC858A